MESRELVKQNNAILNVEDIKLQIDMINDLYRSVMKKDEHYGKIPGTQKDTLLKAGAEKLIQMFRLSPQIKKDEVVELGNGHREYRYIISLCHRPTGETWGDGSGTCSTLESKYKYRWANKPKPDNPDELKLLGKGRWRKINDEWQWQEKEENPDIADAYNTVMKMSYKRAIVAAVIIATGVSDIFTQDLEDMSVEEKPDTKYKPPVQKKQITMDEALKRLDACKDVNSLFTESKKINGEASWSATQRKTLEQFYQSKESQFNSIDIPDFSNTFEIQQEVLKDE
jgi:hypothetical protein